MSSTRYLPLILLLLGVARAQAQEPVRPGPGLTVAALAAALEERPAPQRLGLKPIPPPVVTASPQVAWAVRGSPGRPSSRIPRTRQDGRGSPPHAGAAGHGAAGHGAIVVPPDTVPPDTVPPVAEDRPPPARGVVDLELPEVLQQAADLALRVEGRGGMGARGTSTVRATRRYD
jgi:hypothetical protein